MKTETKNREKFISTEVDHKRWVTCIAAVVAAFAVPVVSEAVVLPMTLPNDILFTSAPWLNTDHTVNFNLDTGNPPPAWVDINDIRIHADLDNPNSQSVNFTGILVGLGGENGTFTGQPPFFWDGTQGNVIPTLSASGTRPGPGSDFMNMNVGLRVGMVDTFGVIMNGGPSSGGVTPHRYGWIRLQLVAGPNGAFERLDFVDGFYESDINTPILINPAAIPEPSSLALMATALCGLGAIRLRKRRK